MKDKLNDMWAHQKALQKKMNVSNAINSSPRLRQEYINQMILAVHEEATEIMRETAYKNPDFVSFGWKKSQVENTKKFQEEIVDLMHFVLNLAIVSGMTPKTFHNLYIQKNKLNEKRKKDGY